MMNKRPISPHLQIYNIFSKEMTSGPSFLNRVTRVTLAFGLIYLTAWLFCAGMGEEYYAFYLMFITSWFGYLSLLGFSLAFYYYLFNGIRFLVFDLGYWMSKRSMFVSGIGMLLVTLISFIATWVFIVFRYGILDIFN